MTIEQISVFLENKPGSFCNVAAVLSENGINMRAMSVAETSDFGILRMIVDDPEKTKTVLTEEGFIHSETPVIAVEVKDRPGSLVEILKKLNDASISLEYMYAFTGKKEDSAYFVFRVDDAARTADVLNEAGINVATKVDIANL